MTAPKEPHPHIPKPGDRLSGKYLLRRVLGAGGMGTVFAAEDATLQREVAIKLLHLRGLSGERLVRSMRREARALAAADHPNIVRVIEAGVTDQGVPFLVMELVEGRTLRALSEGLGPIDVISSIHFALQTARALAFAHKKGIVHGDLKPDNVLVTDESRVKVADFGLARYVEGSLGGSTDPEIEGCGTPHYMAPELFRGERASPASDVYALGATLIELLKGMHMFSRDSVEVRTRAEIIQMHLKVMPEPIERTCGPLVAPLSRLIDTMVAKDPHERPTAREVAEGLKFEHLRLREHYPEETDPMNSDADDSPPSRAVMRALHEPDRAHPVSPRVHAFVTAPLPAHFRPRSALPAGFGADGRGTTRELRRPVAGGTERLPQRAVKPRAQGTEPMEGRPGAAAREPAAGGLVSNDAVTLPLERVAGRVSAAVPESRAPRRAGSAMLVAIGLGCLSVALLGRDLLQYLRTTDTPAVTVAPTTSASEAPAGSATPSAQASGNANTSGSANASGAPASPPAVASASGAPPAAASAPSSSKREPQAVPGKATALPSALKSAAPIGPSSVVDPWAQPKRPASAKAPAATPMVTPAPSSPPKSPSVLPFGRDGE